MEVLNNFSCPYPQYQNLKLLLKSYIHISQTETWRASSSKIIGLRKGSKNKEILTLRKQLYSTGDLAREKAKNDTLFDDDLVEAMKKFQRRHGLNETGYIDFNTSRELNIPVEERIKQISMNMERWRWIPREVNYPYIMINIADYKLEIFDSNKTIMNMKIIVGSSDKPTPLFNAKMNYLVLNPWWEIPLSIARDEMLPEIKQDTSYLSRNNIQIYDGWRTDSKELSADSINWDSITANNFNYRLRQTPGAWNALGQIKFIFPNKYNIYLHDTPQKELFYKTVRTFSHGCIRIEQPIELAAYLLRKDTAWTRDKLITAINTEKEQVILLGSPIHIFICYWTSWIDNDGLACFRQDIYKYNESLENYLPF